MTNIKKLEVHDPTGAFKNINDLLHELRNNNIEALAIVYTRKDDHSTRTYRNGFDRIFLIGTLEQLKYDVMESSLAEVHDYERSL